MHGGGAVSGSGRVRVAFALGVSALVAGMWLTGLDRGVTVAPSGPRLASTELPSLAPTPSGPSDRIQLSSGIEKEARVPGQTVRFVERRYDPPYRLPSVSRLPDATSLSTPEAAAAAYVGALAQGDWDWWKQLWDRDSRAWYARHMLRAGLKQDDLVAAWKREHTGKRHLLLRRIDLPGYAILYFRREDAPEDAIEARQPMALKLDSSGRWWLTHELRENPVYFYDAGVAEGLEVHVVAK